MVKKGKLVSKKEWEKHIESLKSTTGLTNNKKVIKKILKQKIIAAVAKLLPKKRFGILFSGGVDSSVIALIAKKLHANFICYSVGIKNSKDVAEAKKAAAKLKLKLRYKIFTIEEAERIIKKAAAIVGQSNVVNVGVASVEIAAAELAKKDRVTVFFGGLGSEEIFAGYQRHETAKDVNKECWKGLKEMHGRDLIRDYKVAAAMKISFLVPFLDKELIIEAMKIPGKYKICGSDKKLILREVALDIGLPKQFAFRKKLAAQYGSGFDKAIEKLARKNGFRYKKEYLDSLL